MIPFETWLSQIVGYCGFLADEPAVRRAWVHGDYSQTSVTCFDELYEQIFDDLDSDAFEKELGNHLADSEAREMLAAFLGAIRQVDLQRERDVGLRSTVALLDSDAWRRLVTIARRVTKYAVSAGIGSP